MMTYYFGRIWEYMCIWYQHYWQHYLITFNQTNITYTTSGLAELPTILLKYYIYLLYGKHITICACCVVGSQLIRYVRVCTKYDDYVQDVLWFQNYCVKDILHMNLGPLLGKYMVIQTLCTNLKYMFVHQM